jgi:hypothetical protein
MLHHFQLDSAGRVDCMGLHMRSIKSIAGGQMSSNVDFCRVNDVLAFDVPVRLFDLEPKELNLSS